MRIPGSKNPFEAIYRSEKVKSPRYKDQIVVVLACHEKHVFHEHCLRTYIDDCIKQNEYKDPWCPLCKFPIKSVFFKVRSNKFIKNEDIEKKCKVPKLKNIN